MVNVNCAVKLVEYFVYGSAAIFEHLPVTDLGNFCISNTARCKISELTLMNRDVCLIRLDRHCDPTRRDSLSPSCNLRHNPFFN